MMPIRTQRGVWTVGGMLGSLLFAATPLIAQTHKVAKTETVVRAVGVYEWTGDMAKPAASRLIPITLFIDGKFEDAAVYKARPVPFAIETGNVYQLMKAGNVVGNLNLAFARHFFAADTNGSAYDDGWFGYGKFVPPSAIKKSTLRASAATPKINAIDMDDDGKPHFSSRSATPGSGGSATPKPGSAPASSTPADDPDRPTLHRNGTSDSSKTDSGTTDTSTPADDPDRPTLRRRATSSDAPKNSGAPGPSVTPVGSLNDDPGRPILHRGKPAGSLTDSELPRLVGLPSDQDLHQMIAVSDAVDRLPHDFTRPWADDNERQEILGKLQTVARAELAKYEAANGQAAPAPASPAVTKAATPAARAAAARARRAAAAKPAAPAAPEKLADEQLTGYSLSYGGAATFVYFAHTDGLGAELRFVTIVAQANVQGEPEIAVKNVTDATHLDRTPRMKLVDAVDAEASNRASLLFELRAQNSRQFALYRVIGAHADQTFLTGSTQ